METYIFYILAFQINLVSVFIWSNFDNFNIEDKMNKFVYNSWNAIMNHNLNPLKNITDLNTRHMIMQVLAWMWCIIFSFWIGNVYIFGLSAAIHAILLSGIVITVATFETAKRTPNFFDKWYKKPGLGRAFGGEHE